MHVSILALLMTALAAPAIETAKEPSTHLYVRTIPPGAKIILDDQPGTTDGLLTLAPGKHRIVVELDGFAPERRDVDVPQGRITRIEVALRKAATPRPAENAIANQPPPAATSVAGQDQAEKVEELVEKALREPAGEFNFDQTPLVDVVEVLHAAMKINILFDRKALEAHSIDPATTLVKISMRGVSRGSALGFLLLQHDLTGTVRDGAMVITHVDNFRDELMTKVYPIEDFTIRGFTARGFINAPDVLAETIKTTVVPGSWNKDGEPGSIAVVGDQRSARLVVRHVYEVHRRIRQLLATLRAMDAETAAGKTPEPVMLYGALTAGPAAIERCRKAMTESVKDFQFDQTPLTDVVDFISTKHKVEIAIDAKALEKASIDPSTTLVTFSVREIPLGQAMSLLLQNLDLTWVMEGDYVLVTTKKAAAERLVAGVYPIGDLAEGFVPGTTIHETSRVITAITSTIAPESWTRHDGSTPAGPQPDSRGGYSQVELSKSAALVIVQTDAVHRQIAALLAQLRANRQPPASKPAAEKAPASRY